MIGSPSVDPLLWFARTGFSGNPESDLCAGESAAADFAPTFPANMPYPYRNVRKAPTGARHYAARRSPRLKLAANQPNRVTNARYNKLMKEAMSDGAKLLARLVQAQKLRQIHKRSGRPYFGRPRARMFKAGKIRTKKYKPQINRHNYLGNVVMQKVRP